MQSSGSLERRANSNTPNLTKRTSDSAKSGLADYAVVRPRGEKKKAVNLFPLAVASHFDSVRIIPYDYL